MCMFRIKFPTKCILRIFPILRTDGMAPFGTYLWNDPRIFKWISLSGGMSLRYRSSLGLDVHRSRWRGVQKLQGAIPGSV